MTNDTAQELRPLEILGRRIGMNTEWDSVDTYVLVFLNFHADKSWAFGMTLPPGDLVVDYENGNAYIQDSESGTPISDEFDLATAIAGLPRIKPTRGMTELQKQD